MENPHKKKNRKKKKWLRESLLSSETNPLSKTDSTSKRSNHKKKRESSRKRRHKKKKHRQQQRKQQKQQPQLKFHDLRHIFVKEHFENKYNCLRLLTLFVTAIFLVISFLYTVGSVHQLELQNFWCDKYEWDQVVQHNQNVQSITGEGGCYVSKLSGADETKLFAKGNNLDAFIATFVIKFWRFVECFLYSILSLFLLFLFINYNYEYCKDCKQFALKTWLV